MAQRKVTGTFDGTGQLSDPIKLYGSFNWLTSGTFTGTVTLQRCFRDDGETPTENDDWTDVTTDLDGTAAQTDGVAINVVSYEPEEGSAWYRLAGEITSGTASYRLSQ